MNTTQLIQSGAQELGLALEVQQVEKLEQFVELLKKWNKTYNLTAIDTPQEIISKHIFDSLSVLPYLKGESVIDIGSGAGLPGIPLAIVCPKWTFTLLDSNVKKTRFIQQAVIELELGNIEVIQQRIEHYLPSRVLNCLVSRAFARSDMLFSACQQLLENLPNQSRIIFMLGKQNHLEALPKSYNVVGIYNVSIPKLKAQRHIAVVEKIETEQND